MDKDPRSTSDWSLVVELSPEEFSATEREFIERWGRWLYGLTEGSVVPTTAAQRHFVEVFRNGAPATAEHEVLWKRFLELPACGRCGGRMPSLSYSNSICPSCISQAIATHEHENVLAENFRDRVYGSIKLNKWGEYH